MEGLGIYRHYFLITAHVLMLLSVKTNCMCVNNFEYRYEVHTISFQTFFVWAFEIVVDS